MTMAKNEATVSESQIMADVTAGHPAPVYLLTGEESYYIDQLSDFFENNVVPVEFRDFDQTVVYGRDVTMVNVVSMANRYPMMSPYQLVMVKEAQDIGVAANGSESDKSWDRLVSYLEKPSDKTILVLCYRNKKLDKRSKAYQAIKKAGVCYERAKLYDSDVPTWISKYVRSNNRTITEKAAMMLFEAVGNALGKLSNELDKMFLIVKEGQGIDDKVVERNVGISKDYNIFELQNAIGRKDVVRCNKIVNYFADNPKAGPMPVIVANLYSYLLKVMMYHQLLDKSPSAAATVLGVNPYFVKDYAMVARNYSLPKLAACIGYVYDADKRSKGIHNSGTVADSEILRELVFKIIH